jgi:hypothetical protein
MIANTKENIIKKEIIQFYLLFLLTVFFVYFTPPIVNRLYFLLILLLFWNSEKNYFWFAFVFIVISQPGLLFHGSSAAHIHRIPFYNIAPEISLGFFDLFFILAFIKALFKGKRTKLILRKPLLLLLFYLIFLFILSFFYGMNFELISSSLRKFVVFTLFLSFPFLVYKKDNLYKFIHIIFPISFFEEG